MFVSNYEKVASCILVQRPFIIGNKQSLKLRFRQLDGPNFPSADTENFKWGLVIKKDYRLYIVALILRKS